MIENISKERKSKDLLFFNEAIEYFNRFDKKDFVFNQDPTQLSPNQLRDQMLTELNNLREIIANHPDLKLKNLSEEEKKLYSEFMKFYSTCPICLETLHYANLKKFYFDEDTQEIKEKLIQFMNLNEKKRIKRLNYDFGIPCCKCFKQYFEDIE
ncbi:MAG: hypothetical protein ACFFDK_06735 [Promethearchaeota archaeon]